MEDVEDVEGGRGQRIWRMGDRRCGGYGGWVDAEGSGRWAMGWMWMRERMCWFARRIICPGEATRWTPLALARAIRSSDSADVTVIVLLKWMCLPAAIALRA